MISSTKIIMMASKNAPRSVSVSFSLGEVATQFVISLPSEDRLKAQQEVYKFLRWFGEKRLLTGLSIPEVANYAEQITSSTTESTHKLGIIKAFLTYAYKQDLIGTNLAVHLKPKKTSTKFTSSSKRNSQRTISLTTQSYADLEADLSALKEERPRVADELRKAAADKDFRENAPLDAIREYQGQLEARIRELESTLKSATVIDEKQVLSHKVAIGDAVVLKDLSSGEKVNYTLVDIRGAKPAEGKISIASPIGQALLHREQGESIEVSAPAGIMRYRIEDIKRS